MSLSTMSLQAASVACDSVGVTPRPARQRKRGVTTKTKKPTTSKQPRRPRFHTVTVGGEFEVSDGYLERWQVVEEPPNRWGEIRRFRERMRDEDGFLTSKWVETGRHISDNRMELKFPVSDFPEGVPTFTLNPDGSIRHMLRKTPKGTTPNPPVEWFKPVPAGHPAREIFVAQRDEWLAALQPGKLEPKTTATFKEQWFMLAIPDVAKQDLAWGSEHDWAERDYQPPDARSHFPEDWCCKLVHPRPESHIVRGDRGFSYLSAEVAYDKDWAYVQFPVHYWTVDVEGEWHCLTDRANRRANTVECGMWVPRWLLTPTPADQIKPVYDWLVEQYAKA